MGTAYWPLLLIIGSNVVYHACSRCSSRETNPFATLVVTYLIAALGSFIAFLLSEKDPAQLLPNLRAMNLANYLLGVAIIGLEGGFLYLYRCGWSLGVGPVFVYSGCFVALAVLGALAFHEPIGARQIVGTLLCLAGIVLIGLRK